MSQIDFPEKREFNLSQDPGDSQSDMAQLPRKRQRRKTTTMRKQRPRPMVRLGQLFRFSRCLSQAYPWSPGAGWNAAGNDMTVTISLQAANFLVSGIVQNTVSVPNVSEFTNLFDQYRIYKVNYEIYWSQNLSNTGVVAPVPLLHIVNDYDSTAAYAKSDLYQHPDMRTYQMQEGVPVRWTLYPKVRLDSLTTNGLLSSSAGLGTPWLSTSSPNIEYLGTRIFVDNLGRSTLADYGTFLIKVNFFMEFKNVK